MIDGDLQSDERAGPNAGFTAAQLAGVTAPALLVGGTEDVNVPVENNDIAFEQMTAAPAVYQVDVIGANHTHFTNICDIGALLIELGLESESWAALGAEDLIAPYEATCGDDVLSVRAVDRLLNLYAVSFFRRHLLGEVGYGDYLSEAYAAGESGVRFARR